MKSLKLSGVALLILLIAGRGHAQQRASTQQELQELIPRLQESQKRELERAVRQLLQVQQSLQSPQPQQETPQRGGGGRGTFPVLPNNYGVTLNRYFTQVGGAWWSNPGMIARLGLSNEQKTKLDRAFENHRQKLESSRDLLEKEESQLARLLEAESIDRNAVLTQIDRVVQARGEMERANSAMTLEMRESLTRAQWMQVQQQPTWNVAPIYQRNPGKVLAPTGTPGGVGGRGARRGGPDPQ